MPQTLRLRPEDLDAPSPEAPPTSLRLRPEDLDAPATPASPGTTTQGPAAEATKREIRRQQLNKAVQSPVGRGVMTFLQQSNPLAIVPQAYGDYSQRVEAERARGAWFPRLSAAFDTAGDIQRGLMMQGPMTELQKAGESYQANSPLKAVGHAAAAMTPIVGPQIADIGEKWASGQKPEAIGSAAALAFPFLMEGAARVAPQEVNPRFRSQLNPVVQAAVDSGEGKIPMSFGQRTGSKAARGMESMAAKTPVGGAVSHYVTRGQEPALAAELERLRQTVGEQQGLGTDTYTPLQSGESMDARFRDRIDKLDTGADRNYERFRQAEQDPRNVQNVTLGQQQVPIETPGRGTTGFKTVPIEGQMAMPVDMRQAKTSLRPIYDKIMKTWALTQQQASPGLVALRNIVEGPDMVPASEVESNLGELKRITRGASADVRRNFSQGLAAKAIGELEDTVQGAVRQAGPDVVQALNRGRAMTRAKHATMELFDTLNPGWEKQETSKPVGIYDKLTANRDTGINLLRQVQKLAPQEMPKLGRAVIQELLDKATKEGGFKRGAGLQADWARLGPEVKRMLFGGKVTGQLDNFFILAKHLGENPNPSGTAGMLSSAGPAIQAFMGHPMLAAMEMMGSAATAGLLSTDTGSRALVKGLRIPVQRPLQIAASIAEITQLLKAAAPPPGAPTPPPGTTPAAPAQPAQRRAPLPARF